MYCWILKDAVNFSRVVGRPSDISKALSISKFWTSLFWAKAKPSSFGEGEAISIIDQLG